MNIFHLKLVSAFSLAFIAGVVGIIQFIKANKQTQATNSIINDALTAGIFLAVGLIHMLGDAVKQFSQFRVNYFVAFIIAGFTVFCLFLLEYFSNRLSITKHFPSNRLAIIAAIILSLHSFFEGAALGLSNNLSMVLVIFLAILGHKWATAFALAIRLNKTQMRLITRIFIYTIFAFMTPLGIFSGDIANVAAGYYPLLGPLFLSVAAGTFVFLGISHGLQYPEFVNQNFVLKHFSFVAIGFGFMAIMAVWI